MFHGNQWTVDLNIPVRPGPPMSVLRMRIDGCSILKQQDDLQTSPMYPLRPVPPMELEARRKDAKWPKCRSATCARGISTRRWLALRRLAAIGRTDCSHSRHLEGSSPPQLEQFATSPLAITLPKLTFPSMGARRKWTSPVGCELEQKIF